jgi:hypothetical protein
VLIYVLRWVKGQGEKLEIEEMKLWSERGRDWGSDSSHDSLLCGAQIT